MEGRLGLLLAVQVRIVRRLFQAKFERLVFMKALGANVRIPGIRHSCGTGATWNELSGTECSHVLRVAVFFRKSIRFEGRRLGCFFPLAVIFVRADLLLALEDDRLVLVLAHLCVPVPLQRCQLLRLLETGIQVLRRVRTIRCRLADLRLRQLLVNDAEWHGLPHSLHLVEQVLG